MTSPALAPLNRALLSVSDKTGLVELATALAARGVELLSTGGSAKTLRDAGLDVKDVAEITGFPEMMDGRVKTLHPMVHGGLLALRNNETHVDAMTAHGIGAIDLLVVNLYPFEAALARGADYDEMIENIDIGGPAMIRAAAKNHSFVTTIVDVEDYSALLAELDANDGQTSYAFRQRHAQIAYARTGAYDAAVSTWMAGSIGEETPRRRAFAGTLAQTLRYGENPHQQAAFYKDGSSRAGVATATQHQGKELSYNNINDTDAAFELVSEFAPEDGPAVAIIKHANPCGVARGDTLLEAYSNAPLTAIAPRLSAVSLRSTEHLTQRQRQKFATSLQKLSSRPMPLKRPAPSSPRRKTCACSQQALSPILAPHSCLIVRLQAGFSYRTKTLATSHSMTSKS